MNRTFQRLFCASVLVALALNACHRGEKKAPLRIAAASDLTGAFGELAREYESTSGRPVNAVFGSSSELAAQIENGAPYDLFAAADAASVDRAVNRGACDGATRALYARGRLALWSRDGGIKTIDQLAGIQVKKIALANPAHAPYGRIAKEALERTGIWQQVSAKIVFAGNVRQALQVAQSGNADAALVALALVPRGEPDGVAIPESLYTPLDQMVVACGDKKDSDALGFLELLASNRGRDVLKRYRLGFDEPPGQQ